MRSRMRLGVFGVAGLMGLLVAPGRPAIVWSAEPVEDKPSGYDLDGVLEEKEGDRRPHHGVLLRTTKAEVLERGGRQVLRVHWEFEYTGKRWPLVILEPSLDRETNGQTHLTVFARGKSGKGYGWTVQSPGAKVGWYPPGTSKLEWFAEITHDARKAAGTAEADFAPVKEAFVRSLPDEFSPEVTPKVYVRLVHQAWDRAEHLHIDAWTGDLMAAPRQVVIGKW